jgi:integrase/recombinase XerD
VWFTSPWIRPDRWNGSSSGSAIVVRIAEYANASSKDFRPFPFHDLRHLHAVNWLKDGRSIYDLQKRSAKTRKAAAHFRIEQLIEN